MDRRLYARFCVRSLRLGLVLAAGAILVVGCRRVPPPSPPDVTLLLGTWEVVAAELGGREFHDAVGRRREFLATTVVYTDADGQREEGDYRVDPNQNPPQLDTTRHENGIVVVSRGIFLLEKDRLVLCVASPGRPRPTAFTTQGHSDWGLLIMKRVPAESAEPDGEDRSSRRDAPGRDAGVPRSSPADGPGGR